MIKWKLNYWRRNMNFNSYPSSSCKDSVNCRTLWVKPDFVCFENYQFCAPPMYRPSFYTCTKSHFYNFWKFSQNKGSYMQKKFVTSKMRIHTSMYTSVMFRCIHQRSSSSCFCKSVSFLAFLQQYSSHSCSCKEKSILTNQYLKNSSGKQQGT